MATVSMMISLTGFNDWPNLSYSLVAIANPVAAGVFPLKTKLTQRPSDSRGNLWRRWQRLGSWSIRPAQRPLSLGTCYLHHADPNQGRGPALQAVLTDTRRRSNAGRNLNAIVVGGLVTRRVTSPCPSTPVRQFYRCECLRGLQGYSQQSTDGVRFSALQILDVAPPTLTVTVSPAASCGHPVMTSGTIAATIQ